LKELQAMSAPYGIRKAPCAIFCYLCKKLEQAGVRMESIFTKPDLPRYTQRPFPSYRYLPFQADAALPHPRNDPSGHSFDQEEVFLPEFAPADWRTCETFLYGIDLFNHGYWWEAHEAFETVWHAAGRSSLCGKFIQGLIQLSGAQLKRFVAEPRGAQSLTRAGIEKLSLAEGSFLGIEVAPLIDEAQRCLRENRGEFPRIELHF
jgi:predicted metal-dependent hydrolase